MSKLSNTLRMIELLHGRGKMKISELAEELEVKERMIRIYRDELEKAGIFVESERGRGGGYYISNTSLFPIKNLSHKELRALTFAIEQLLSKGNAIYSGDAQVALDKLKALRKLEKDRDRHIYFVQRSRPNYEFSDENRKYIQLQEAFGARCKVKIQYEKRSGERSERVIAPYGFVHYNEFFYCIAMCDRRKDTRMFKLSRIKDIQKEFPRFGIMKEPLEVELLIHPPFSVSVPESIWGDNQIIEHNPDGSIRFHATMSGKESIKKWILGMGAAVEVMKPDSLREDIIQEGKKLLGLYEK
ncbi:helix-turn-helix transcriptional regulator [Bacillus thuringiensis]|uniref:helix-turn-helix transcriptional regulator n=1 Tax=Bacillus thuringiensis TaxID=1428 RepID=UPI003BF75FB7